MAFVRGANPIWSEFDTSGNLFDDTYYLFVLENTIPYLPATVYRDPVGNIPWTFGIPFQANGTLPDNIFFDPSLFYRLEFRQGPTQAYPLIGNPIENYSAASGSSPPAPTIDLLSDNQVTNSQFSLIDFSSPYTITSGATQNVDVAPGWVLELIGTGNVTLTQVPLNNSATTLNSSNAPYALEINVNGTWSSVILRQRFQQNGMLWANKTVSSTITARIEGAQDTISATLVDSNNTVLGTVLASTTVTSTFEEYTGSADLGDTTNPDLPPAAYIDYHLILPTTVDIYVTSFQLVVGVVSNIQPTFQQDTIDRQIDYTFHNYRESILFQPKNTILTGWNFRLNPWQFRTTTSSTITASQYTADQTIVSLQNASSLEAQSGTNNGYFGIQAVTSAAQGKFALIQYIDTKTIAPYWGSVVSSLVKAAIVTAQATELQIKMRLIHRATVPPAVDPISSWAATDPTFTAGWTAIAPRVDNVYTIDSATFDDFVFEGFQLPVPSASTQYLGIVLYTVNTLNSTAVADLAYFDKISLVPNEFAIDTAPQTYNQVLRECFFYYEKSYAATVLPGTTSAGGALYAEQLGIGNGANNFVITRSFDIQYKEIARTTGPTITLYSPTTGTSANVRIFLRNNGASVTDADIASTNWTPSFTSSTGSTYLTNIITAQLATAGADQRPEGYILYHYTKDGRLGLVA